ncbi:MAG: 50S ribosomal protein L31e [Candidatus Methanomethylicia archaeon]
MSKGKEEIVLERIYTIPLRIAYMVPRNKRTPRAVRFIRSFLAKHMKSDKIIITPELNEILWARGIQKPPRKIRVRVTKDSEGIVKVYPFTENN